MRHEKAGKSLTSHKPYKRFWVRVRILGVTLPGTRNRNKIIYVWISMARCYYVDIVVVITNFQSLCPMVYKISLSFHDNLQESTVLDLSRSSREISPRSYLVLFSHCSLLFHWDKEHTASPRGWTQLLTIHV